jgi:hypothetical protein
MGQSPWVCRARALSPSFGWWGEPSVDCHVSEIAESRNYRVPEIARLDLWRDLPHMQNTVCNHQFDSGSPATPEGAAPCRTVPLSPKS